ncbi:MAG: tripartite tricarboxylate transporter TctB family protein [Gammaproteobacteria bacterium]|nr:tripartite tricarboxylate transporter TctB family protein [Gammaproteobacteria bacterium]
MPLALAAFAVLYLVAAWNIPLDPWSAAETVNARALPIVYGVGLLVVSIALLAVSPASQDTRRGARWKTLGAHCVAIAAFGLLIPYAGLWIATAVLLLAALLIAGERRLAVLAIAPVATAGTAWFLIAVALDIYVDPGVWL